MELTVSTRKREDIIDITSEVDGLIAESGTKEGICNIYVPHATAAITVNENADPNVGQDILDFLKKNVPEGIWKHDRIDGNADSHIKSSIIGPSETVPIKEGKLALGKWQDLFLCDFDGPRKRKIIITIIPKK
ncbi:secondary thiamine-phosphate synthase enzyme YjbQ [Thermoproteota archaeon]